MSKQKSKKRLLLGGAVLVLISGVFYFTNKQLEDKKYIGYYNVGPDEIDCVNTGTLVDIFCEKWGDGLTWKNISVDGPHEANFLKLDCSKLKTTFGLKSIWHIDLAIEKTIEWTKVYINNLSINDIMNKQIKEYIRGL